MRTLNAVHLNKEEYGSGDVDVHAFKLLNEISKELYQKGITFFEEEFLVKICVVLFKKPLNEIIPTHYHHYKKIAAAIAYGYFILDAKTEMYTLNGHSMDRD